MEPKEIAYDLGFSRFQHETELNATFARCALYEEYRPMIVSMAETELEEDRLFAQFWQGVADGLAE